MTPSGSVICFNNSQNSGKCYLRLEFCYEGCKSGGPAKWRDIYIGQGLKGTQFLCRLLTESRHITLLAHQCVHWPGRSTELSVEFLLRSYYVGTIKSLAERLNSVSGPPPPPPLSREVGSRFQLSNLVVGLSGYQPQSWRYLGKYLEAHHYHNKDTAVTQEILSFRNSIARNPEQRPDGFFYTTGSNILRPGTPYLSSIWLTLLTLWGRGSLPSYQIATFHPHVAWPKWAIYHAWLLVHFWGSLSTLFNS